ncbi:hypothetical protein J2Y58_002281 [Sphingomonas sp. BE138]|uniref:hypothetical protein n=1 Tax=Sphingomonas sp. BE138 TaxID=2817845 RepID=UPI0028631206|nr:hypothetical protein [Sphingomonas sp. BE138]MDR6788916.1 hypothetical protein [Sphingomonas sp. BE138]
MIVAGAPGVVTLGAEDRARALAAVRAELRAAAIDDDALALAFVEAALGLAEQFTGRVLIVREVVADLDGAAGWQVLPVAPVRAITAAGFAVDIDAQGVGWVKSAAAVRVTFTAGLASGWAGLPAPLRQGVAMLAAHLFSDRAGSAPVPAAVSALWRPFRDVRLAQPVHA